MWSKNRGTIPQTDKLFTVSWLFSGFLCSGSGLFSPSTPFWPHTMGNKSVDEYGSDCTWNLQGGCRSPFFISISGPCSLGTVDMSQLIYTQTCVGCTGSLQVAARHSWTLLCGLH